MTTIRPVLDGVKAKVNAARDGGSLEKNEVLNCLVTASGKVTQTAIARACPLLGSHWRDGSLKDRETTLRKVRSVIRALRLEDGVPILSDPGGYWLPSSTAEVDAYVNRVEKQAKATARAWFETIRAVESFLPPRQHSFLELLEGLAELPKEPKP